MAEAERTERFQQLEERVNQRVREALSGLQGELRERLRRAGDQVLEELDRELQGAEPELSGTFLSREELGPLAEEAAAEAGREARRQGLSELLDALSAIDRSDSQSAVLSSLVRQAGRFAARSALFLARPQGLELWSAHGWDEALDGTVVEYADDGPWSQESLGRGTSTLGSGESGRLCGQVDAPLPAAGLLVPVVLRDRLAAVLYADHGEGEELLAEGLQVLTYAAALALETLPFRERSATPTLAGPGRRDTEAGEGPEGESLGVWTTPSEASGSTAAAPGAEPEPEPEPEPLPDSAAFGAGEGEETARAGAGLGAGGEASEATPTTPPPAPPAEAGVEPDAGGELYAGGAGDELAVEDAGSGGWALEDEPTTPEGPAAEVGELQVSEPEPPVDTAFDLEGEQDLDEDLGDELTLEPEASELDVEPSGAGLAEASGFELDSDLAETGGEEEELEEAGFDLEPEPLRADEEEASWSPGLATAGTEDREEDRAVETPEAAPPGIGADDREATADLAPPAAAPPASPPPAASPAPGGGSQVAPPSDLEGPGRAFAGADQPAATESDARHDEARRLARLLVSEIRLYNEEEVDEGRRNNDIYERLKEDIDRSRQMYEDRVDPSIREDTDYFYQELVRNLGGGDAGTLGI